MNFAVISRDEYNFCSQRQTSIPLGSVMAGATRWKRKLIGRMGISGIDHDVTACVDVPSQHWPRLLSFYRRCVYLFHPPVGKPTQLQVGQKISFRIDIGIVRRVNRRLALLVLSKISFFYISPPHKVSTLLSGCSSLVGTIFFSSSQSLLKLSSVKFSQTSFLSHTDCWLGV